MKELEKYMNNQFSENIEPEPIEKLLAEYSDFIIEELSFKIKECKEA